MKYTNVILFDKNASKKDVMSNKKFIATLDDFMIDGTIEIGLDGLNILETNFILEDKALEITNGMILKVFIYGNYDYYRINATEVDIDNNSIFVYARQITYDIQDIWIEDLTPTNLTCEQTLNYLKNNSIDKDKQYVKDLEFYSNLTGTNTSNYYRKNLHQCLTEDDNAILNKWNGEIKREAYKISILSRVGNTKPTLTLQSKKNIYGFTAKEDIETVVNRFKPVGYDGKSIDGYVLGRNAEKFPKCRTEVFEYPNIRMITEDDNKNELDEKYEWFDDKKKFDERLTELMKEDIQKNNYDTLMATYTINFLELNKYSDYQQARQCRIGDNVYVCVPELNGLIITVRCVSVKYDIKNQEVIEVQLTNKPIDKIKPITLQTIITTIENTPSANEILEQAKQNTLAQMKEGLNNSYVIVKQNVIYIGDSPNINNMSNVIIMNKNGISFSNNGVNGTPNIAMSISGSVVADRITTGVLSTILIRSLDGKSYFNLENGEFVLADENGNVGLSWVNNKLSLAGDLEQYDPVTGNYSLEIINNLIHFYDRWDSLGNKKNTIGYMGSTRIYGEDLGYNVGNTSNVRVGTGIIAEYGDYIALMSRTEDGKDKACFVMENSVLGNNNINQGCKFGFFEDVAMINGSKLKWFGTLHNFIGDIYFDSNSKMNIWGTGGINLVCGTSTVLEATKNGVVIYGTFQDSSDILRKSNIKKLEKDTIQIVKDVDIYQYTENGTTEIGLLAQEAIQIIPEIINGKPTNTTIEQANTMLESEREERLHNEKGASVDVYSMLSVLWDANKKMINKIEELENRLIELENSNK